MSERPKIHSKPADPASFSLHPPKATRLDSLPPPTPSREGPIAVPLETTALPPVPLAVSGEHPALKPPSRKAFGHPMISVAAFTVMMGFVAFVLMRYLGVFEPRVEGPPARVKVAKAAVLPFAEGQEPTALAKTAEELAPVQARPATSPETPDAERLATLLATLPEDPEKQTEALLSAAARSVDEGDLGLAETLLGQALKLGDQNPHVAFALARLRLRQGNLEGAEGWAAKAIRLRPRRSEYLMFYGQLLERMGRAEEAARALTKARSVGRAAR